jgi:hypothetical protein
LYSCNNSVDSAKKSFDWVDSNNALVKKTYSKTGAIIKVQLFTKDTVPSGAEIDFYNNGVIKHWKYYTDQSRLPRCVVYYDSLGKFDTLIGMPFIDSYRGEDGVIYVKTINPPATKSVLLLDIYKDGKKIDNVAYSPISTDSMGLTAIGQHNEVNFRKDAKGFVYYHIIDSNLNILSGASYAMVIDSEKYIYKDIPPEKLPQKLALHEITK